MKRKKLIISLIALLVVAFTVKGIVISQIPDEKKVMHITEKMTKKLDLSDEQKNRVYQINLTRFNGHKEVKNKGKNKEDLKVVVATWEKELKMVLNAEQIKKLNF